MKKQFLRLLPLTLFVVACGGRFQSQNLGATELAPVQSDEAPVRTQVKGKKGTYQIIRYSKAITLAQVQAKQEDNQFVVNADLTFNGVNQGAVEMIGPVAKSGETILVPKSPELQDKFKAKVTCTSDDDSCSDYFIDFFAKDGQTVYVDQYVQESDVTKDSPAVSTETTTTSTTTTTTTSSTTSTNLKPSAEPSKVAAAPSKAIAVSATDDDDEEDVEEIPEPKAGRYVGASDREIVGFFEKLTTAGLVVAAPAPEKKPAPAKPEPTSKEKPKEQPKTSPSAQDNTQDDMGDADNDEPKALNQAIGTPGKGGRLQNATNLLELAQENAPWMIHPERVSLRRYYSTNAVADFLKKIGDFMDTIIPNYKLILSDASSEHGGVVYSKDRATGKMKPGHQGHENGNDIDIAYITKDSDQALIRLVNSGKLSRNLMLKEQWALMKAAYQTGQVAVIFVDPVIKHALCYEAQQEKDLKDRNDRGLGYETLRRIMTLSGHANHFHVRVKCGEGDSTCRDQSWTYGDSGCFGGKK